MVDQASDPGWRRGDLAAWWDARLRRWRQGTLVARVTIPTFEYDVTTPEGDVVRVPERLLRSPQDPDVPGSVGASGPPLRPGASLRDRSAGRH